VGKDAAAASVAADGIAQSQQRAGKRVMVVRVWYGPP
jgi:hypothetical protein